MARRPASEAKKGRPGPAGSKPAHRRPRSLRNGEPQGRPGPISSPWRVAGELLPPLPAEAQTALARLPEALARVRPLSGAHRRSLPEDIASLSRALTAERAELRRPYWSRPAFVSAYVHYFLPWNLVRLARLFRGLPLPAPGAPNGPPESVPLLLDAGSGPLTVPLALWLARPEWRKAPIEVLALDSAAQPLELGRALFIAWGEVLGQPVWRVRLARGPLESLAAKATPLLHAGGRPWLITAANVLNELGPARRGHRGAASEDGEDAGAEDGAASLLEERLDRLLGAWVPLLAQPDGEGPGPALLFVEPGTRLGGSTIMRLRELALAGGLSALAPCTADNACPLARGAWCHFSFSPQGAPAWLAELSAAAGLAKRSLTLSPLLLRAPADEEDAPHATHRHKARVLSSPFAVPGLRGRGRYACASTGLALLEDAASLASGALVDTGGPQGPWRARRDAVSGAHIFAPPERQPRGSRKKS